MDIQAIANVVSQVGLPIGLIVWGVWFISTKVWPWFADPERRRLDRELELGKTAALEALASALTALAQSMDGHADPDPN